MRILIHTCCAPCLIYPLDVLISRGYLVVPFFYNPNIHPFTEYRKRYFAALDFCSARSLEFHAGKYEIERFLLEVSDKVEERCKYCFKMRLDASARQARLLDIGEFTTTLLSSPYQNQELIKEAGEEAAIKHGVIFLQEDWTSGYSVNVQKSRSLGIYRQAYCGCVYSEKERYQKSDPPER
ncbi:MAG: epoxyqueuosine reductase QueH [Actinomycetota bacterium]|nr:epoxyqueuosine reductase QueH [Actinomycetota bacterium]